MLARPTSFMPTSVCRQSESVGPSGGLLQVFRMLSQAVVTGVAGTLLSGLSVTWAGVVSAELDSCPFSGGAGSGQADINAMCPHWLMRSGSQRSLPLSARRHATAWVATFGLNAVLNSLQRL